MLESLAFRPCVQRALSKVVLRTLLGCRGLSRGLRGPWAFRVVGLRRGVFINCGVAYKMNTLFGSDSRAECLVSERFVDMNDGISGLSFL